MLKAIILAVNRSLFCTFHRETYDFFTTSKAQCINHWYHVMKPPYMVKVKNVKDKKVTVTAFLHFPIVQHCSFAVVGPSSRISCLITYIMNSLVLCLFSSVLENILFDCDLALSDQERLGGISLEAMLYIFVITIMNIETPRNYGPEVKKIQIRQNKTTAIRQDIFYNRSPNSVLATHYGLLKNGGGVQWVPAGMVFHGWSDIPVLTPNALL